MDNLRGLGIEYADVTADTGYESEENYTYFEGITTECYIKLQNYERSKTARDTDVQKIPLSFNKTSYLSTQSRPENGMPQLKLPHFSTFC